MVFVIVYLLIKKIIIIIIKTFIQVVVNLFIKKNQTKLWTICEPK